MAEVKPLRLKAQRVAKKVAIAPVNPVAQICVDTGVFHLPDTYDYLVPADLHEFVVPGIFVKVPFGPWWLGQNQWLASGSGVVKLEALPSSTRQIR